MSFLPSKPKASLVDVLMQVPAMARPMMAHAEAVLRAEAPFTPAERELMFTYVSALNGCRYCEAVHSVVTEELGEPVERLQAVLRGEADGVVRDELLPVLAYVRKLTVDLEGVTRADVDAVLAAGWGEDAVIQAAMIAGTASLANRVVSGLGIEPVPEKVAMGGRRLAAAGYLALNQMLPE